MRSAVFGFVLVLLPACFSEAADSDDGTCLPGALSCPCDAGACGPGLTCEPSIQRCIQTGCDPGISGCSCSGDACTDGSVCTMGVCTTPGPGTGTSSSEGTTARPTITDSDPVITDSDPAITDSDPAVTDSASDTTDTGPLDTGASCITPECDDCNDCGSCATCVSTPVLGACSEACSGDPQCEALVACALTLDDPTDFAEMCCDFPCDEAGCSEFFAKWRMCVQKFCICRDNYAC